MLKKSVRRTYRVSRSQRNFDSRKAQATAKAKTQKTFTDKTKVLSPRRKPQVLTGCQKTARGCFFVCMCFILAGVLFGVLWIVLIGGLLITSHLVEVHLLKT